MLARLKFKTRPGGLMRRLARVSLSFLLLFCVHAQDTQKGKPATRGAKGNVAAVPVARAKDIVYDDIAAAFRAVKAAGAAAPKSEFETTAQYQARLGSWRGGAKKYVFVVEKSFSDEYTFEYDADAEEMHLTVGGLYLSLDDIQVRSGRTVLGTSAGTNPFGVKMVITNVVESNYHIKLDSTSPFRPFSQGTQHPQAKFSWTMRLAEAKANKKILCVAVVGTIPRPEATEETAVNEATISRPKHVLVYTRTLPCSLEELRVVNPRTGATFASFRQQESGQQ